MDTVSKRYKLWHQKHNMQGWEYINVKLLYTFKVKVISLK